MAQTPVTNIPAIIKFGYNGYTVTKENGKTKTKAVCNICGTTTAGVGTTTSNYITHIVRTHKRKKEYEEWKEENFSSPSASLLEYRRNQIKYDFNAPEQLKLIENIALNLCVDCDVSTDIVEKEGFKRFIHNLNPKYDSVSREAVSLKITEEALYVKQLLIDELASVQSLSLTVNIWCDGKTGGFVAILAHYVTDQELNPTLTTVTLAVERLQGAHAEENTSRIYRTVLSDYGITEKVSHIIIDNMSDLYKSLDVEFPKVPSSPTDQSPVMYKGVGFQKATRNLISKQQQLTSFAHSLQLVIADGMKAATILTSVLHKVRALSELQHSSTSFQKAFEQKFGKDSEILKPTSTGWLSTFQLVESVVSKGRNQLAELGKQEQRDQCIFNRTEWEQLEELITLLAIFAEATINTQTEKQVSISLVVPTVLSLYNHTTSFVGKQLTGMASTLKDSLLRRFEGIFTKTQVISSGMGESAFTNDVYMVATALDPNYQLLWVNVELSMLSSEKRELVQLSIKELICSVANKLSNIDQKPELNVESVTPPPAKTRLLGGYRERLKVKVAPTGYLEFSPQFKSIRQQLQDYLNMDIHDEEEPYAFWKTNSSTMPELAKLAMAALSVPAMSFPLEHVFNDKKAQHHIVSNDMVAEAAFLRCNRLNGKYRSQEPQTFQLNFL